MEKILFLNEKDRNAKNRNAQDCNASRPPEHSDYRYYNVKPVEVTGSKRDGDGFIKPHVMFRPVREVGLLSELCGDTPIRRYLDLRMNLNLLMKESYEHMIEQLMCNVRQKEVCCQLHFAKEDREWERYTSLSEKGRKVDMPQVTPEEHRRMILNAITWKYDWIQQNKKRCFQFAEAVIDCKIVANQKPCTLFVCENGFFGYEDRRMKPRGTCRLRGTFWLFWYGMLFFGVWQLY